MEYEIGDEDVLFDDSANPSQKRQRRQSAHIQAPAPTVRPRVQQGELIPEEEDQTA